MSRAALNTLALMRNEVERAERERQELREAEGWNDQLRKLDKDTQHSDDD